MSLKKTMGLRFTENDYEMVVFAAQLMHLPTASFVRQAVLDKVKEVLESVV